MEDPADPCPFDPSNDEDQDGACGDADNCPRIYNPDQEDTDQDGTGDACEFGDFFQATVEAIPGGLLVRFTTTGFDIIRHRTPFGTMIEPRMDGLRTTGESGRPAVPVKHLVLEVPWEVESVVVSSVQRIASREYPDVVLYPFQIQAEEEGFQFDEQYYDQTRGEHPGKVAAMSPPGSMRHRRLIGLDIYPLQYVPAERRVSLITSGEIVVRYTGYSSMRTRPPASRAMDAVADRIIGNPGMVGPGPRGERENPRFVVIAPDILFNHPTEGDIVQREFIDKKPDRDLYDWRKWATEDLKAQAHEEGRFLPAHARKRLTEVMNDPAGSDLFVMIIGTPFDLPPAAEEGTGLFGTNISRYSAIEISGELRLDPASPRYLLDCGDWCELTLGPNDSPIVERVVPWASNTVCTPHDPTPRPFGVWVGECKAPEKQDCVEMTLEQAEYFSGELTEKEKAEKWPHLVSLAYSDPSTDPRIQEFTLDAQTDDALDPDGDGWVPFRVRLVNYGEGLGVKLMRRPALPDDPVLRVLDRMTPSQILRPEDFRTGPGEIPGYYQVRLRLLGEELEGFCGVVLDNDATRLLWRIVVASWLSPDNAPEKADVVEIPTVNLHDWVHLPSHWKGCKQCPEDVPADQDSVFWGFQFTETKYGRRLSPLFFRHSQFVGDFYYTLLDDDFTPDIPLPGRIPIKVVKDEDGEVLLNTAEAAKNAFNKIIAYENNTNGAPFASRVLLLAAAPDLNSALATENIRRAEVFRRFDSMPRFETIYTFGKTTSNAQQRTRSALETGVGLLLAFGHGTQSTMAVPKSGPALISSTTLDDIATQAFFPVAAGFGCEIASSFERYTPDTLPEVFLTRFSSKGFSQLASMSRTDIYHKGKGIIRSFIEELALASVPSQGDPLESRAGLLWTTALGDAVHFERLDQPGFLDDRQWALSWHVFGDPSMVVRFANDLDEDGIANATDDCLLLYEPDQADSDKDGAGDSCDACPEKYDIEQLDLNSDLIADACQPGACVLVEMDSFHGPSICRPVDDPILGPRSKIVLSTATILHGSNDHCLACEFPLCPNREYRISFKQRRLPPSGFFQSALRGVVCASNEGILNDECQEFELSDAWTSRSVLVRTGSKPQAIYFGARWGAPSWPLKELYLLDDIVIVGDGYGFHSASDEAWMGPSIDLFPGQSLFATNAPLATSGWLGEPAVRGRFVSIRTDPNWKDGVCLESSPTGWSIKPQGLGYCTADQAEPIGMPISVCPVLLNPAFRGGDRYLVSMDYFTRHQAWTDDLQPTLPGAFVELVDSDSVWGDIGTRYGLPARTDGPGRAIFVATPLTDGAFLRFCQMGFGHYLVDNIRIWRLP